MKWSPILGAMALAACQQTPAPDTAQSDAAGRKTSVAGHGVAQADGSYLARIDPLGGSWSLESLGGENVSARRGYLTADGGGFISHGAQCGGGFPLFYKVDGDRIATTRREPVRPGKCGGARGAEAFERRWAAFLDDAVRWEREGDTLRLASADGAVAVLSRPTFPFPEIAGRWKVVAIGGKPFDASARFLPSGLSAQARCNTLWASYAAGPNGIDVEDNPAATQQGCTPTLLEEDGKLFGAFARVTGHRIESGRLVLTGGPGLELIRPDPTDRRLAGRFETCGNSMLGASTDGDATLVFARYTVTDAAGCRASYRVERERLFIDRPDDPRCAGDPATYDPGMGASALHGRTRSSLAVLRPDGFAFDEEGRLVLRTVVDNWTLCRVDSDAGTAGKGEITRAPPAPAAPPPPPKG